MQQVLLIHQPKITLLQKSNFNFVTIELDFSGFTSRALLKLILVNILLVTKFKSSLSLRVIICNDKISILS